MATSAARLATLAKNAAPAIIARFGKAFYRRAFVRANGEWGLLIYAETPTPLDAVMVCPLTPEYTVSSDAFARALLASAVDFEEDLGEHQADPTGRGWACRIGRIVRHGATRTDALAAILDSLLARPAEAH